MNAYLEMKKRHQAEAAEFPVAFAFSEEQFEEAMKKLGLKASDASRVCSLYGIGDIFRKEDVPSYIKMREKQRREMDDAVLNDKSGEGFVYDMFDYELANHEYGYTLDPSEALEALGYSWSDIESNRTLQVGFEKACKHQIETEE